MTGAPKSWQIAKVSSFCKIVRGSSPRPKGDPRYYGGPILRLMVADITRDGRRVTPQIDSLTEEGMKLSRPVPAETVVMVVSGNVGKMAQLSVDACIHDGFVGFLELDQAQVLPGYLMHYLETRQDIFDRQKAGAIWKNLTTQQIKDMAIPLPPLDEQRRIAAILDKADAVRRKRQRAIEKSEEFLRSVFSDMFGDPVTNSKGWDVVTLENIVSKLEGGKNIKPAEFGDTQYRILKVSAVTWAEFRPHESKPVPPEFNPPFEFFVRKGDLLFSRANTVELVGAVVFVWDKVKDLILPDKLWRFVWSNPKDIEPLYMLHLLQTAGIRRKLGALASGTSGSMKNISKQKLMTLKLPMPKIEQQRRFADLVKTYRRKSLNMTAHQEASNSLFNSLVQRAFRGEL